MFPQRVQIQLLCAVFAFGMLSPIVATGFYWDDSVLSGYAGTVEASGLSLPQHLINRAAEWAYVYGRIFPVGIMMVELESYFFGGGAPLIPKLVHISLIVGTLAVVGRLVAKFSNSCTMGALFMLISPLCFQVRPWHDPLTSFVPLIPFVSLLIFGQALMLDSFVRIGGWQRLSLSVFLFAVALLTYELALVMPLINAVVVLRHRSTSRRIALMTLPYVVVFAAYLGAIAAVRSGQVYPGISFGSVEGFGRSFLVHLVGAVPFSYWLFDPKGVFGIGLFQPTDAILIGGMAVGLGALFMLVWNQIAHVEKAPIVGWLVGLGTVAWISSSALMASSERYRTDIADFGMAYNASFIGATGIGILVTCGVTLVIARFQKTPHPERSIRALGAAIAFVPVLWLLTTNTVLRWQENLFGTAQQAEFNRAAKAGLLADVQDGAVICEPSKAFYWLSSSYIRMFTHKKVDVNTEACATNTTPTFKLEFQEQNSDWLRRPQYFATLHAEDAVVPMLAVGETIDFGARGNRLRFLGNGWFRASEPTFSWTDGRVSIVSLVLSEGSISDLYFDIVLYPYLCPPEIASRVVAVTINGGAVQQSTLTVADWQTFRVTVPQGAPREISIKFKQGEIRSPTESGCGTDPRHLALAVKAMTLRRGKP